MSIGKQLALVAFWCVVGNFLYQWVNDANYWSAIERSYFQCLALGVAWLWIYFSPPTECGAYRESLEDQHG